MNPQQIVLERVLPGYETLGPLSFAWAQGSLVSRYTTKGDYDVILAWDMEALPSDRSSVVSQLDDRNPEEPFVVNYRDINVDRFVIGGQEFNLGHATPHGFKKFHVDPVLSGVAFRDDEILQPVVAVSGFFYGEILTDPRGEAAAIRESLATFPEPLRNEALRQLRVRRNDLRTVRELGEREDWIPFFRDLSQIVRVILLALFASHDIYYPGDKWIAASLQRFSIDGAADLWGSIWRAGALPAERTDAADALAELANSRLAPQT
jgi:hypothetical protein